MNDYLEAALTAAYEACRKILEVYNGTDLGVSYKADESPVTAADLAAHHAIARVLAAHSPYPIVSEEFVVPFSERRSFERFWLVDPLDGTKEFIARNGEFTVNIALIERGKPILGVVAVPVTETVYGAIAGQGAFRIANGKRVPIRHPGPSTSLIAVESRSHPSPKTREFCARHNITQVLSFGSAVKLCKIAEGVADVYPRFGPTCEWDTAAGDCILRESGCVLIDSSSHRPLAYNKEDVRNPSFIAAHRSLLAQLADERWE